MNPDNGAHTSWPLGKLVVPDFVTDTGPHALPPGPLEAA
jgi:hypothetical protein